MTPKEKAIELYENFAEAIPPTIDRGLMERDWISSKECALIAVDEMIEVVAGFSFYGNAWDNCRVEYGSYEDARDYYQAVKEEITKL